MWSFLTKYQSTNSSYCIVRKNDKIIKMSETVSSKKRESETITPSQEEVLGVFKGYVEEHKAGPYTKNGRKKPASAYYMDFEYHVSLNKDDEYTFPQQDIKEVMKCYIKTALEFSKPAPIDTNIVTNVEVDSRLGDIKNVNAQGVLLDCVDGTKKVAGEIQCENALPGINPDARSSDDQCKREVLVKSILNLAQSIDRSRSAYIEKVCAEKI